MGISRSEGTRILLPGGRRASPRSRTATGPMRPRAMGDDGPPRKYYPSRWRQRRFKDRTGRVGTVRLNGTAYRLIGFDTPERGDKAQCDEERRRAESATHRLLDLIATGNARLTRVACACPPGREGSRNCNYGRLCGSLTIGGRDVGQILIGEGLARSYTCGATSCPRRRPWC
jgi:endonuclease YncB( thermonuclease family)